MLPVVERMFAALADTVHPDSRAVLRDIARALDEDPAFRRRFLSNPGQAALVRDTISLTVLEGGARTNVAPAEARAHVDARLLPGGSCDDFARRLAKVIDDPGVRIEILLAFPSNESPIDTALYRAVEAVALRDDPGAVVVPRMIAGFTDAHWFREVGIVAYGFVPRWLAAADTRGIHGVDERVSIQNLVRGTRTQVAILEALSAGD